MCESCRRAGGLTRRQLLRTLGVTALGAAAAGLPVRTARARQSADTETVTLTATVQGAGTYTYLPFDVPEGVNRIHAVMEKDTGASLGFGLFDQRGAGYQSEGFRGVYGAERAEFFVAADAASQSFLPGPIEPGTWTVIVPVFQAEQPTRITVTVTLTFGPEPAAFTVGATSGVVRDEPGWYRGDLHAHTPESSDAWASDTALTPADWARTARDLGMDFVALTDHNVVSQNFHLAADTVPGILLMAGEEMTNWFHGHATVSGLTDPTGWIDWRQRPDGVPLQRHEARIEAMIATATDLGAYVSAAHPLFANISWQFFADGRAGEAARTHGLEVWTGQFTPDSEAALELWDDLLLDGWHIVANGGSDLHGVDNDTGFVAGTPTTVVHAERLERGGIVAALRAGRSFVTRRPDGVETYLSATGPGGQREIMGGTIHGAPSATTHVELLVRGGQGRVATVTVNGREALVAPITADEQTVSLDVPVTDGGFVRAEVRTTPTTDPEAPLSGHTGMEALTNPIFLAAGPPPEGKEPDETAPPPRDQSGDGGEGGAGADPAPGPAPKPGDAPPPGAPTTPSTGGGAALAGGALIATAAAITRRLRDD